MQSHIAFWNSFHVNTKNVNRFPLKKKKKNKYLNRKKKSDGQHLYTYIRSESIQKSTKKKKKRIKTPVKEGTATDEFNSQQLQ